MPGISKNQNRDDFMPGMDSPVYGREQPGVLPTPLRMAASPEYMGRGVVIAFVDSGFYPHPDLTRPVSRILHTVDATGEAIQERVPFRTRQVVSWHGMMVACVAAGNGWLSGGYYRGIASESQVVLIKVSNRKGGIHEREIARGLRWLVANGRSWGVRIVNLSVGGSRLPGEKNREVDDCVDELVRQGVVVVAAAGNAGIRRLVPPATAAGSITVGGLDDRNALDPEHCQMVRSNYGLSVLGEPKPDVLAPAIWIAAPTLPRTEIDREGQYLDQLARASDEQLVPLLRDRYATARFTEAILDQPLWVIRRAIRFRQIENKFIHAHYQHVDGTSFAASIVSSIIAQMLQAQPGLSPAEVKQIITGTAIPLPDIPRELQGYGVINAREAVAQALRMHSERFS